MHLPLRPSYKTHKIPFILYYAYLVYILLLELTGRYLQTPTEISRHRSCSAATNAAMGIGQMTIPLYLSALPEGMTLTIDEVIPNTPPGMYTHFVEPYKITIPHTFTTQEINADRPSNNRGAKILEFKLRTDGAFDSGQGGSFLVKFTIKGRPDEYPDAEVQNTQGTLTIGTSEWGRIYRPDQTNFVWTIGDQSQTYSAKTPTWTYLDDSVIIVSYVPENKAYVFGVTNQQDFLVKIMQQAVAGISIGHKILWTKVGTMIALPAGVIVGVVTFGADVVNSLK